MSHRCLIFSLAIYPALLFATTNNPPDDQLLSIKNAETVSVTCPKPSLLIKSDEHKWYYQKFWRSYNTSFASKLDIFKGAQWSGSDVGSIICIYSDSANNATTTNKDISFPVEIHFSGLVKIPTGENWVSQPKKTYKNCLQNDVKKCGFIVYVKSNKKIDYYKESEAITPKKTIYNYSP